MVRASFLIPRTDNLDQPFSQEDFDWLRDELVARFGGFTSERRIEGEWYEAGTRFADESYRFLVVLEEAKRDRLEALLRAACARFRQEAIYLELCPVEVETISATESGDRG